MHCHIGRHFIYHPVLPAPGGDLTLISGRKNSPQATA